MKIGTRSDTYAWYKAEHPIQRASCEISRQLNFSIYWQITSAIHYRMLDSDTPLSQLLRLLRAALQGPR